jgi:hypothetical protein
MLMSSWPAIAWLVGLFVTPTREAGLSALTIETSQMLVLLAVGHRLSQHQELRVADILDEPFPGAPILHPQWRHSGASINNAAGRRG